VLQGNEFLGTDHPTEKPIDLLGELIKATTDEGACVADPFVGVGSTVIAAYDTNRDYWACELDKRWHQIATDTLYARMEG
jgi:DNA modification methylase